MADEPRDNIRAAIEAKIAAWQATLRSYDAAVSGDGAIGDVALSEGSVRRDDPGKGFDLPVGVFRDKSIPEAVEIFLAARRRKQTNKEIAQGLKDGGIASTSSNFEATLATALGRMRDDGKLLRFPDGWDLASSYPDGFRQRLAQATDGGASKKRKAKKKPAARGKISKPSTKAEGVDKTAVAVSAISAAGASGVSISELHDAMQKRGAECPRKYVRGILSRLSTLGKIEQREGRGGRYFWKAPTAVEELKLRAV